MTKTIKELTAGDVVKTISGLAAQTLYIHPLATDTTIFAITYLELESNEESFAYEYANTALEVVAK